MNNIFDGQDRAFSSSSSWWCDDCGQSMKKRRFMVLWKRFLLFNQASACKVTSFFPFTAELLDLLTNDFFFKTHTTWGQFHKQILWPNIKKLHVYICKTLNCTIIRTPYSLSWSNFLCQVPTIYFLLTFPIEKRSI